MFENSLFFNRETIELDHGRIKFGNANNITLVWKIISEYSNCNSSEVHLYPWCEPGNIQFVNITSKTHITLPSEISGMPSSISISSLPSDHSMTQCPELPDILQFDCKLNCKLHTLIIHLVILAVNHTETVPLLLGNNKCTCLEIPCNGGLTVVVTTSNSTLADIICPAYVLLDGTCFNIGDCANFNAYNAYHPFFHICENPMDHSRCSVCFENITTDLNGVKLFFYTLINTAVICSSQEPLTRAYFRSFQLYSKFYSINYLFVTL